MVEIEKDIIKKYDLINSALHSDEFLDLSREAQCLYVHLVMNSDSDCHVWRAKAVSRMLFSGYEVSDYQMYKPLKELVNMGFISHVVNDLFDEGYEFIER